MKSSVVVLWTRRITVLIALIFSIHYSGQAISSSVNNVNDSGAGSLRALVGDPSIDTIFFDMSTDGSPINLTTGSIEIDRNLVIIGNDSTNTIIDGQNLSQIFRLSNPSDTLCLSGLTLRNGNGFNNSGGAASIRGTLIADMILVQNNTTNSNGGGLAIAKSLILTNSSIIGNTTDGSSREGGGIDFGVGAVGIIDNCVIENNQTLGNFSFGGAISLLINAELSIINSSLRNNKTTSHGGAIGLANGSRVTVTNCNLSENFAADDGGAIYSFGKLSLNNTVLINNNAADEGGAMNVLQDSVIIMNSTITGNSADDRSGGIAVFNLNDSNPVRLAIQNTIIAKNTGTNGYNDIRIRGQEASDLVIRDNGFNLIGDTTEVGKVFTSSTLLGSLASPLDPQLECSTVLDGCSLDATPSLGSIVIDAGDPDTAGLKLPRTDVNGRSRFFGGKIDIGAVEFQPNSIIYVDSSVVGGLNDGSSWANARTSLNLATVIARSGDQIWVAKGTYYKLTGFNWREGVSIIGGLNGTEDPFSYNLCWRNFDINETILSGNTGDRNDDSDNASHVVTNNRSSSVLDGFTITGGRADRTDRGAGIMIDGGSSTFRNLKIVDNEANDGGAVIIDDASPIFENVHFLNNKSRDDGGAIVMVDEAKPIFNSCVFLGNDAQDDGGAVFCDENSEPIFINCSFSGNNASNEGGAIYYRNGSVLTLRNTVIWNNKINAGISMPSASLFATGADPVIASNSLVQNFNLPDTSNLDGTIAANDPDFISVADPNSTPNLIGDLRLQSSSPLIDKGSNATSTISSKDAEFKKRIDGLQIDIGAFEDVAATTWYADIDFDNYGGADSLSIARPYQYYMISELSGSGIDDCNDNDPNEKPGQIWYIDADEDDYGASSVTQCLRPANGFILAELMGSGTDDCDDTADAINPGASEIPCNEIDENCNGMADDDNGSCSSPYSDCSQTNIHVTNELISSSGDSIFFATQTIISDATIDSFSTYMFRAGGTIELNPNFNIGGNKEFVADIGPCD